ncbi:hypothetical protein RFI_14273 [Reticulomyxa filosa]|uniref:Fatty acid hydroxylase domain-containing protein n=1 Tax=Reticulomyxa filosa TaxID=46433 RepID=X6N9G2_RETFI|nr:hypothetical protein RFI_14273 [Reticulomyxa filosa]|eukprot:ETO22920.1 hypothetical protein RFI_14273 [Reticulomyxa filosa]
MCCDTICMQTEDSFSCGAISGKKVLSDGFIQVIYWYGAAYLFLWVDNYHDKNKSLGQHRIFNPGRNPLQKVEWSMVQYAFELSFWNILIGLVAWLSLYRYAFEKMGLCEANNLWFNTYSYTEILIFIIIKIPLHLLFSDMVFYFTHRLCHENKWLYKNVHKKHHIWNDSYACASIACHPLGMIIIFFFFLAPLEGRDTDNKNKNAYDIEHLIVNLPTVFCPQVILCGPYGFQKLWMVIASVHTCFSHCGAMAISATLGGVPHDFHHHFQSVHFGSGGYCDWFFKTRLCDKYPDAWNKILSNKDYEILSTYRKLGGFVASHKK